MINANVRSNNIQLIISVVILIIGVLLLVYMILVESEPGALPLALVLGGLAWMIINLRLRKSNFK